MRYRSTRDTDAVLRSFEYVAMQGLAADGGLFVPEYVRAVLLSSCFHVLPCLLPSLHPSTPLSSSSLGIASVASLMDALVFFIERRFPK
jgi:hypothetical protein